MQLCNLAEIEKEEVEFPASATLWQGNYIRWQHLSLFMYIVQLYKEDWGILHMLGCQAIALPSTEQIVYTYYSTADIHPIKHVPVLASNIHSQI